MGGNARAGAAVLLFLGGWVYGGVSVTPSVTEREGRPGQTLKGVFKVRNDGKDGQIIQVQPELWPPGSEGVPLALWLDVKPKEFELGPGKEVPVRYRVKVPVDAVGELGAQVYFASSVSHAGALPLRQRFGCAMYVRVEGTERYDVRLASVTAHRREKETVFEFVLENQGNVHVRPKAFFEVVTSTGQAVVALEGTSPIYAGTRRTFFGRLTGEARVVEKSRGIMHLIFPAAEGERAVSEAFTLE